MSAGSPKDLSDNFDEAIYEIQIVEPSAMLNYGKSTTGLGFARPPPSQNRR